VFEGQGAMELEGPRRLRRRPRSEAAAARYAMDIVEGRAACCASIPATIWSAIWMILSARTVRPE